jgi:hypothetical protein
MRVINPYLHIDGMKGKEFETRVYYQKNVN